MFVKKFLNLPFLVLSLIIFIFFFGDSINQLLKSHLYAVSLLLKDIIVFLLPIIIFSFVLSGILNLKGETVKILLVLVPLLCCSNFLCFWLSYFCTVPVLKAGIISISKLETTKELLPAWSYPIKPFIKNDIALILGIIVGLLGTFLNSLHLKNNLIENLSIFLYKTSNFVLKRIISPMLPLFVLGFIVKMYFEETLTTIIKEYSILFGLIILLSFGCMLLTLFLASSRSFKETIAKSKNLLPSVLVGLFSMSSAAAMPSAIIASEKNLANKDLPKFIIPTTANINLLGDSFAVPIIGLALMFSFGFELPTLSQYLVFSFYGVLVKFAAAGIPGGSALIFVPIFESIFGFSAPMLTALTAIYVLFDPFATSSNVFGHGVFAVMFEKIYNKFSKK